MAYVTSSFIMAAHLLIASQFLCTVSSEHAVGADAAAHAKVADIADTISHAYGTSWNEVMCDAFSEAALVLVVFGVTTALLTAYRQWQGQGKPGKNFGQARKPCRKPVCRQSPAPSPVTSKAVENYVTSVKSQVAACQPLRNCTRSTDAPWRQDARKTKTSQVAPLNTDSLAAAVRNGRAAELPQLLDRMLAHAKAASNRDIDSYQDHAQQYLLSALRACAAARCFKEGMAAYDHVAKQIESGRGMGFGSHSMWSLILYIAVEAGTYDRCESLFGHLCAQGHVSGHDIVNMVRCYSLRRDIHGVNGMLAQLHSASVEVDNVTWNRSLAACASVSGGLQLAEVLVADSMCKEAMDAVSYNTLMKCNARAGRFARCMELWSEMLAKGFQSSEVTFGILLDACAGAKDHDKARQIFEDLCKSGLRLNAVHCTTFIKCLVSGGRVDEAASVLDKMLQTPGAEPDLITYSTLVKAYADSSNINGAMRVLKRMLSQNITPDEIAFNSVLSGCCAPCTGQWLPTEILQVWDKLLELGMRPTTTTLSILMKAFAQSEAFTEAIRFLEDTPSRLGMQPDMRLFTQLVQACIKVRKGGKAVETFRAMVKMAKRRGEEIGEPVGRLIRHCSTCAQFDTAFKLCSAADQAGIEVDPQVLNSLRDAAARKRKSA